MADRARKTGRPPRRGSDLEAAREAILGGCSMYETARRSGISMYMFVRLRKELKRREIEAASESSEWLADGA